DVAPGPRRIVFDAPLVDLSARELRARAARGGSLRYLVPDAVWRHITSRGLYRDTTRTAARSGES
ncbi:MAG: nicotinate-nucleotide adenylyltransferase, partial [Candidatus Limnocylindria bacterium]